jgi:hypothetical protein
MQEGIGLVRGDMGGCVGGLVGGVVGVVEWPSGKPSGRGGGDWSVHQRVATLADWSAAKL